MCEIINSYNPTEEFILTKPDEFMRVQDFFKGRHVLITGVTGFMGKVLIEKLLWCCEDIGNVYVLLRGKKGSNPQDRLDKILNSEIFERIRNRNKKTVDKIIAMNGDMAETNLGIDDSDKRVLHEQVSVVFHMAANVRFEEPLDKAIICNVRGTRDVLNLSRGMKNLKAFVHVSTTYTNTDKDVIEEKVYTKDADWNKYISLAETLKDDLNGFRDKLLGSQPNTYTFTKYLAENVVNDYRHSVPVIIFRPSIVAFCLSDPLPGWAGNFNGPIGIWVGVITGVIHVLLCKASGINDYIPCDYAINALILSAWYRGNTKTDECVTINAASGELKKISPEILFDLAYAALEKYPPEKMLWFPAFKGVQNYYLYIFLFTIQQIIPGMIFDALFALNGVSFRILPIYRKIYSMNNCLLHFVTNEWQITTTNYYQLNTYKHPHDRDIFPIDLREMDNVKSSYIMIEGFKKYILKEKFDDKSIKKARRNFERMYIMDCILKGFLILCFFWIIYYISSIIYQAGYDLMIFLQ